MQTFLIILVAFLALVVVRQIFKANSLVSRIRKGNEGTSAI